MSTSIVLRQAAKRYRFDWIFRRLDYTFEKGNRYALLGPNGSGKSTLLKVLSGHVSLTKGSVSFYHGEQLIDPSAVFRNVAYAAPYIELIEEFTLLEALRFHRRLKPLLSGFDEAAVMDLLALPRAQHKEIRFFSSGMKQRLKLALAVCSDTPILLLDEPATNLDVQGIEWYKNLIHRFAADRLVIIASNDPHDAAFCERHLHILDYKRLSGN